MGSKPAKMLKRKKRPENNMAKGGAPRPEGISCELMPNYDRDRKNLRRAAYDHDFAILISVVGDAKVGKTSLANRLVGEPFHAILGPHYELRETVLVCKGWRVKLRLYEGKYYTQDAHGVLICFDASRPEFDADVATVEEVLSRLFNFHYPATLVANTMFAGLKADLVPSLLHDPWLQARRLLVAIRPCVDPLCAFAVLPCEVVYQIALLLPRLLLHFAPVTSESSAVVGPSAFGRKKVLESFCDKYERPLYLASALHNVGISEMLHAIVERTLDTYGVVPNPASSRTNVANPYCVRDFPPYLAPDEDETDSFGRLFHCQ